MCLSWNYSCAIKNFIKMFKPKKKFVFEIVMWSPNWNIIYFAKRNTVSIWIKRRRKNRQNHCEIKLYLKNHIICIFVSKREWKSQKFMWCTSLVDKIHFTSFKRSNKCYGRNINYYKCLARWRTIECLPR